MKAAALNPVGMPIPVSENDPVVDSQEEHRFSYLIAQTEQAVLEYHPEAAHFRYPYVYGPRQLVPREWSIMRRVLDKRPHIIVADAGLSLSTHGYVANLAHSVLLAGDKPKESAGQIYNCGDQTQYSMSQIIEVIAAKMGHKFEFINMPYELALPARAYITGPSTHHRLMDTNKIQSQLDYRDVNPVDEALGLTVDWLLENMPEPGGELEERLQDPFNYEGEDRLIEAWQKGKAAVAEVPFEIDSHRPHPYAHPKKPGEKDHRGR